MCPNWNKDLFDKKKTQPDPKWPKGLLNRPRSVKTDPIGNSALEKRGIVSLERVITLQLFDSDTILMTFFSVLLGSYQNAK